MTKFQIAIFSAIAVVGTAISIAFHNEAKLRAENKSLRQKIEKALPQTEPMAPPEIYGELASALAVTLPAQPVLNNSNELLQLRGEVARMRHELAQMLIPSNLYWLDSNAQHRAQVEALQDGTLMNEEEIKRGFPRESWNFSGYATPKAAAQSLMWALSQGDAKTLFQSYTPEALQWKYENPWKGKSEAEISDLVSVRMQRIAGFRTVGQMLLPPQRDSTIFFMLSVQDVAGKPFTTSLHLKKIGNEWKCSSDGLTAEQPQLVPQPRAAPQ